MKIKGFTVTEVVIVTGIIGLIAVLTMPTFISNQKKHTYSKSLQVAIVNFESVMSNLLTRDGVDDLLDTTAWEDAGNVIDSKAANANKVNPFVYNIGRGMAISSFRTNIGRNYQDLSGNGVSMGSPICIVAKNGVEYFIEIEGVGKDQAKNVGALQNNSNYTNKAADISIDVNGNAAPNIYGRDLFKFELGVDGILYPLYGDDYNFYNNNEDPIAPETGCVTNKNSEYCAAYLMNNNYEMNY